MATKNVLVRILQNIKIHATQYFCNDVVSMPAKLAAVHEKAGSVDSDDDAVSYARDQLGKEPIEHIVPEGAALLPAADPQPVATGSAAASVSTESPADGQADVQAQIPGVAAADPAAPAAQQ